MPRIGDDSLIVRGEQRRDASWLFTIRYLVHFDPSEIGQRFDDSVQVCDEYTATPVPFVASGLSLLRTKRVVLDGRMFTELRAHDDVYATVCLRRRGATEVLTRSAPLRMQVGTRL